MLPSIFGENLLDEFFDEPWEKSLFGARNPLYGKHAKNLMKTDVKETGDHYEVDIDLPGFQKDEISVELQNGYLTIQAAKGLDRDQKDQEGRYIRQERYSGTCSRSFYVGDVQPEEINAKYDSGILMLTLPKKDQQTLPTQTALPLNKFSPKCPRCVHSGGIFLLWHQASLFCTGQRAVQAKYSCLSNLLMVLFFVSRDRYETLLRQHHF